MTVTSSGLLAQLTDPDSYPERPTRFRARGIWQSREAVVEYDLHVDHDRQEWSARDLTTGVESSYEDGILTTGSERSLSRSYRSRVTDTPLQLLFPEHLPVWGRRARDTDTPIGTEVLEDGQTLVILKSLQDPAIRKTLVVEDRTGIITRFYDTLTVTAIKDLSSY